MSDEREIEDELNRKGKPPERITPEQVDAEILCVAYVQPNVHATNTLYGENVPANAVVDEAMYCLTVCILILQNGTPVVGQHSASAMDQIDSDIGKRLAYADARAKVWPIMADRERTKRLPLGTAVQQIENVLRASTRKETP